MKKFTLLLIVLLISTFTFAQDISGQWNGLLKIQGTQMRITFNLTKTDAGYSSTMDSPDQKVFGIPVTFTTVNYPDLKLTITNAFIEYTGKVENEGKIAGTFTQGGQSFPLDLTKDIPQKEVIVRPQDPVKPYPYKTEDVKFINTKDNDTLAGTITMPSKGKKFPAVILISGSGPQDRNEELVGHRPFLVIADYLTRHGIAVLRFDDRGTGESTGNFMSANTVDLAGDVMAAVDYMKSRKEIDQKNLGLIGHSEGGIIAPMVAVDSKDIAFIVLMAGTGIRGDKLLLLQEELISKASGVDEAEVDKMIAANKKAFEIVIATTNQDSLKTKLTSYVKSILNDIPASERPEGMSDDEYINFMVAQMMNPWMLYFIRHDPSIVLEQVKCPVLAINGSKDLQVPSKVNLEAIEKALTKGGNTQFTIRELPGLNHIFQECSKGTPDEYSTIEQTTSPVALGTMTNWIKEQTEKTKVK